MLRSALLHASHSPLAAPCRCLLSCAHPYKQRSTCCKRAERVAARVLYHHQHSQPSQHHFSVPVPAPRMSTSREEHTHCQCVFRGNCAQDLADWLELHGVDTRRYGKDTSKTIGELLEEQAKHESLLNVVDGRAMRTVKVLSLHITNGAGQVLFEDEQILPDGRSRRRNVLVSEKLMGDESWRSGVERAVKEELGTVLPEDYQIKVDDNSYQHTNEFATSMSYPGLLTKYICHRVSATVTGLPQTQFETCEPRPKLGGRLITRWVWRNPGEVEGYHHRDARKC